MTATIPDTTLFDVFMAGYDTGHAAATEGRRRPQTHTEIAATAFTVRQPALTIHVVTEPRSAR